MHTRLGISIRCAAHELSYINATSAKLVCMYVRYIIVQGIGSDSLRKLFSIQRVLRFFAICEKGYFASGNLWERPGVSGNVWERLGSSGSVWKALRVSGNVWDRLGASGNIWPRLETSDSVW